MVDEHLAAWIVYVAYLISDGLLPAAVILLFLYELDLGGNRARATAQTA